MALDTTSMFDDSKGIDVLLNVTDSTPVVSIYPKRPDTTYWMSNVITVIIGLVGNSLVFLLMRDAKFSLLSYPIYLRVLSVSDSAVLILFCLHQSLRFFHSFHIIGDHEIGCRVWMFMRYTVMTLSPWLVVGLTVDRFVCVVFPLTRNRFCTPRKAKIVCSCLIAFSILITLPLLEGVKTVDNSNLCFIEDHLMVYFAFIRLVATSNLPCFLILVLNIVIGIHIQRSATFRKRFTSSTSSGSTETKLDKSLRPLMLISILAFVTLLPSSTADSVILILVVSKAGFNELSLLMKLWPLFNILYLLNFGQNFYILMVSSVKYRNIMKRKLKCHNVYGRNDDTVRTMSFQVSEFADFRTNITETSMANITESNTANTSITEPSTANMTEPNTANITESNTANTIEWSTELSVASPTMRSDDNGSSEFPYDSN
ncbi:kappa-type opioid receptor-like [Gigantopelta aegis]|uniref:kappa-type opioid receptor-like n=1 Tax=Gigantopelta aegis TaxID=1735272 RepID=UPI001B88C19D|nr:kappa-type opioid receptor-like [Gigantopelta aegis]